VRQLSAEDREGIACYPSKIESARTAFEILSTSLDTLEYFARRLAERSRERFADSTLRSPKENAAEINKFMREQKETVAAKAVDKKLRLAITDADRILANLPPVTIPKDFNLETFKTATGASDAEIMNFAAYRVQRERWQVGLGAPSAEAVETAVTFFQNHSVAFREGWLAAAREFCAWRMGDGKIL
jgi:hypothetical protein